MGCAPFVLIMQMWCGRWAVDLRISDQATLSPSTANLCYFSQKKISAHK